MYNRKHSTILSLLFVAFLVGTATALTGCGTETAAPASQEPPEQEAPAEQEAPPAATPVPDDSPYALVRESDGARFLIDARTPTEATFEYEQSVTFEAEFPFPPSSRYYGDMEVRTLVREAGECIYYLRTTVEGYRTPAGIGVGSTRDEVFAAYGADALIVKDTWEWSPDSGEPEFDEALGYAPEDGTSMYLALFLRSGSVVMIETADGLDGRPVVQF